MGYISLCYTANGASGENPGGFVLIRNNWDFQHIQSNCVETNSLRCPQVYNLKRIAILFLSALQQTAGNQSSFLIKQQLLLFYLSTNYANELKEDRVQVHFDQSRATKKLQWSSDKMFKTSIRMLKSGPTRWFTPQSTALTCISLVVAASYRPSIAHRQEQSEEELSSETSHRMVSGFIAKDVWVQVSRTSLLTLLWRTAPVYMSKSQEDDLFRTKPGCKLLKPHCSFSVWDQ